MRRMRKKFPAHWLLPLTARGHPMCLSSQRLKPLSRNQTHSQPCMAPQDMYDCHNVSTKWVESRALGAPQSTTQECPLHTGCRHFPRGLDCPKAALTLHVCACTCRGVRRGEPAPAAQRCHSRLSQRPVTATAGKGPISHTACRPGPHTQCQS